jgi:hypothetical protein
MEEWILLLHKNINFIVSYSNMERFLIFFVNFSLINEKVLFLLIYTIYEYIDNTTAIVLEYKLNIHINKIYILTKYTY